MQRVVAMGVIAGALGAGVVAVAAPLPPDPVAVWSVQDENAALSTARLTDRYYANGLRIGYASPSGQMPAMLDGLAANLWGEGRRRYTVEVTQQIYTPRGTSTAVTAVGDRPYAGVLMGTLGVMSDTAQHRSAFSVGIGMVGPSALGGALQNGLHDIIGQPHNPGWGGQLRDEPEVQVTSARIYRVRLWQGGGLQAEALPELTAGLGTLRSYLESGVTLRVGQGLEADFGPSRLRPGPSGGDVFSGGGYGWYVFAGLDGRGVARDATLDGDLFSRGPHVKRDVLVGEGQAGFAVLMGSARLSYTHVMQSSEFSTQRGGLHQLGAFALSVRF